MTTILLIVIYIAFISLGLPDSLLGSAWPTMHSELNVGISYAGMISMIISGGTIVSSLFSDKMIRRFGTAVVTIISVGMTAIALLGFSFSSSFWQLCLWGIPYGLGAGSVDAALNNFVALNYKSRHMSWLHCFWGIGATAGPYIMGLCLTGGRGWNAGYQTIGVLQVVLVICLILSLPLWKAGKNTNDSEAAARKSLSLIEKLRLPGVKVVLAAFFFYCAVEATTGLWASSFLVYQKGVLAETAAKWASLFYLGITAGRFICGFVADLLGDRKMIRIGVGTALFGGILLLLSIGNIMALLGLICIGLGCAPVFPSMLHLTPVNFGPDKSQAIMGMQMAFAYMGTTLMPPVFGVLADKVSIGIYPICLVVIILMLMIMVEKMNTMKRND